MASDGAMMSPMPGQLKLRQRVRALGLLIILAFFVLAPSALRYSYNLSSFAPGVVGVAVAIWGLALLGIIDPPPRQGGGQHFVVVLITCGLLGTHVMLTYMMGQPELGRPFLALAFLGVILLMTRHIGHAFFSYVPNQRAALQILLGLFGMIGVLGLLGIAPPSELSSERPLYPFTEPSHFAFTVMPFLIYATVTTNKVLRLVILAVTAALVILLKSLSLAVGLILAGACSLGGAALVVFLILSFAGLGVLDLTYFTDRLDFTYGNQNLSMLVYRQGIELIQTSLIETNGAGIGFQRLGFTNLFTPSSNIIYALTGADLNLRDGGFNMAKLVTELGMIGLILSVWYLFVMVRTVLQLRQVAQGRASMPEGTVFAMAAFVGISVEMLVRGAGYFTSTMVLALAAIPYIRRSHAKVHAHAVS